MPTPRRLTGPISARAACSSIRRRGRVEVTTNKQLWAVLAYIHQNPQKHGLLADFRDWKWSSYGSLLSEGRSRLSSATVLSWFGGRLGYQEVHGLGVPG